MANQMLQLHYNENRIINLDDNKKFNKKKAYLSHLLIK